MVGLLDRILNGSSGTGGLLGYAASPQGIGMAQGLLTGTGNFASNVGTGLGLGQANALNTAKIQAAQQKGTGAKSTIGKIMEDYKNGVIDAETADAALAVAQTKTDMLGNFEKIGGDISVSGRPQGMLDQTNVPPVETNSNPNYNEAGYENDLQAAISDGMTNQPIYGNEGQQIKNKVEKKSYLEDMGKSKAALDAPQVDAGIAAFDQVTNELIDLTKQLSKAGGKTKSGGNWLENAGAYFANTQGANLPFGLKTPGGQDINQVVASPQQTMRNQIEAKRPLLLTAIMRATGLTATQLNSNVELQNYLKTMGSATADDASTIAALKDLNAYVKTLAGKDGQLAPSTPAAPVATKRWNPETRKIEAIQ
jgi:hypothetical protein